MQRLRAAQHPGQRLDRGSHDVVVGLLRGERHPRGLGVKAQPLRLFAGGTVDVTHPPSPDPPGGAELRDLFEEVHVRVEEERQTWGEAVDVEAAGAAQLHVPEPVGEREG